MDACPVLKLLRSIRVRAIRHGTYYRNLTSIERAITELSIRCRIKFRSFRLLMVIARIIVKLRKYTPISFFDRILSLGKELVKKVSLIAYSWGNVSALSWIEDRTFVVYLGMMVLQRPFSMLITNYA